MNDASSSTYFIASHLPCTNALARGQRRLLLRKRAIHFVLRRGHHGVTEGHCRPDSSSTAPPIDRAARCESIGVRMSPRCIDRQWRGERGTVQPHSQRTHGWPCTRLSHGRPHSATRMRVRMDPTHTVVGLISWRSLAFVGVRPGQPPLHFPHSTSPIATHTHQHCTPTNKTLTIDVYMHPSHIPSEKSTLAHLYPIASRAARSLRNRDFQRFLPKSMTMRHHHMGPSPFDSAYMISSLIQFSAHLLVMRHLLNETEVTLISRPPHEGRSIEHGTI